MKTIFGEAINIVVIIIIVSKFFKENGMNRLEKKLEKVMMDFSILLVTSIFLKIKEKYASISGCATLVNKYLLPKIFLERKNLWVQSKPTRTASYLSNSGLNLKSTLCRIESGSWNTFYHKHVWKRVRLAFCWLLQPTEITAFHKVLQIGPVLLNLNILISITPKEKQ